MPHSWSRCWRPAAAGCPERRWDLAEFALLAIVAMRLYAGKGGASSSQGLRTASNRLQVTMFRHPPLVVRADRAGASAEGISLRGRSRGERREEHGGDDPYRTAGPRPGSRGGRPSLLDLAGRRDHRFRVAQGGDWQVYTVDSRGSEGRRAGSSRSTTPAAPRSTRADGRYLYFSRDDRGSECFDIYRYDLRDGSLVNLLPDTPKLSISLDFDLSPDGTRLAFAMDYKRAYAAAVMPAEVSPGGADIRVLTDHGDNDWAPDWAPDGASIAFHSDTEGQDGVVAHHGRGQRRGARDRRRPPGPGLGAALVAGRRASSPSAACAATTTPSACYDVRRDIVEWVHDGDSRLPSPGVGAGRARPGLHRRARAARTSLQLLDLATSETRQLTIGRGNHYHPRFTPDGTALVARVQRAGRAHRPLPHRPGGRRASPA